MARRAAYLSDVFEKTAPTVLVAGSNEILGPQNGLNADKVSAFVAAYERMGYHVGLLTDDEAEFLKMTGVTPGFSWKSAAQQQVTVVTLASGKRVAFLRFPSLAKGMDVPDGMLIRKIGKVIQTLQQKYDLVVGLSSWGRLGEREYLADEPEYVPDLLLGGGHGSGVPGRIEADGRCMWVRPFDKGRILSVVNIQAWPDRRGAFTWEQPNLIEPLTISLGDQYTDDPDIAKILQ